MLKMQQINALIIFMMGLTARLFIMRQQMHTITQKYNYFRKKNIGKRTMQELLHVIIQMNLQIFNQLLMSF